MSKFNVGDKVKGISEASSGYGFTGTIIKIDPPSNYFVDFGEGFNGHNNHGLINTKTGYWVQRDTLALITEKQTLTNNMEIDEIKKFSKSVLSEANLEVQEEIANEQKETAKTKLRELYSKKKEAEAVASSAASDLKDITKDLKDLRPR